MLKHALTQPPIPRRIALRLLKPFGDGCVILILHHRAILALAFLKRDILVLSVVPLHAHVRCSLGEGNGPIHASMAVHFCRSSSRSSTDSKCASSSDVAIARASHAAASAR